MTSSGSRRAIAVHDGLLIWEVAGMNRQETRKAFVDIIQTMFSGLLAHIN